jgi:hypothetical protein
MLDTIIFSEYLCADLICASCSESRDFPVESGHAVQLRLGASAARLSASGFPIRPLLLRDLPHQPTVRCR